MKISTCFCTIRKKESIYIICIETKYGIVIMKLQSNRNEKKIET